MNKRVLLSMILVACGGQDSVNQPPVDRDGISGNWLTISGTFRTGGIPADTLALDTAWRHETYSFYPDSLMVIYEFDMNPRGENYEYCTYHERNGKIFFARDSIRWDDDSKMYWSNEQEAWVLDSNYVKNGITDTIEFSILGPDSMKMNVIDHLYGEDHGGEYVLKRTSKTPFIPPRVL